MNPRTYANHYRQTAVSSAVLEADPHRLVALLYTGTRQRLQLAAACIQRGDLARKAQAISEASLIVGQLDGALDHAQGGDVAAGLAALYDYAQRRMVEANASHDAGALLELDDLFRDIESAWEAIAPGRAGTPVPGAAA